LKDPGLPNNYPLKHQLLQQIARDEEENKMEQRRENELMLKRKREEVQKQEPIEEQIEEEEIDERNLYIRQIKDIINNSDIVFEILDARDPLGTRSKFIEKQIREIKPDIKIVLVLSKIDLVPKRAIKYWTDFLRKELPVVVYKSDSNLLNDNSHNEILNSNNDSIGVDTLLSLLKKFYSTLEKKRPVVGCLIGFPLVGKSTIIDNLKKTKSLSLGFVPDHFEEEDYSEKKN